MSNLQESVKQKAKISAGPNVSIEDVHCASGTTVYPTAHCMQLEGTCQI